MNPVGFEIRQCANPGCRLRFPVPNVAASPVRCPACLGETVSARQETLPPKDSFQRNLDPRHVALEAVLDNLRSAENVGSIFRSADGLGMHRLYLVGITPTPMEPAVRKASLGAESGVDWSHHNNGLELAHRLQQEGHAIWALENAQGSTPVQRLRATSRTPKPPVLVIGNEIVGVDPGIVEIADRVLCLPMSGRKTSFNAAVAFALAVYALTTG